MKYFRRFFLVFYALILVGCSKEKGIYFPAVNSELIGKYYKYVENSSTGLLTDDNADYLEYNGNIYILSYWRTSDMDELVMGESLATVYGFHEHVWSTDEEKLYAVSNTATLYEVKGYNPEVRVCIVYNLPVGVKVAYFDKVNDVILKTGADLYEKIYQLDESMEVYYSWTGNGGAVPENIEISGNYLYNLEPVLVPMSIDSDKVQNFLSALYEGEFVDPRNNEFPDLENMEMCCFGFVDSNGICIDVEISNDGYVLRTISYNGEEYHYLVKVDKDACVALTDIAKTIACESMLEQYQKIRESNTYFLVEKVVEPILKLTYYSIEDGLIRREADGSYFYIVDGELQKIPDAEVENYMDYAGKEYMILSNEGEYIGVDNGGELVIYRLRKEEY